MRNALAVICLFACCSSVLDRAHNDYVSIVSCDSECQQVGVGTGVNSQYGVLTVGHLYGACLTHDGVRGFVVKLDKDADIMLVNFANVKKGKIKFATPEIGQHFILYGSAYGFDGAFTSHHVFKLTDMGILFYPPPHPGQSGSALFLDDGRVIGITRARVSFNGGDELGLAVPSQEVMKFLENSGLKP